MLEVLSHLPFGAVSAALRIFYNVYALCLPYARCVWQVLLAAAGSEPPHTQTPVTMVVYSTCCIFVANRVSVEDTDVNCAAYMKGCPCTFSTKWHSGAKGTLDSAGRLSAELAAGAVLPP
jgi:hypothetical protein